LTFRVQVSEPEVQFILVVEVEVDVVVEVEEVEVDDVEVKVVTITTARMSIAQPYVVMNSNADCCFFTLLRAVLFVKAQVLSGVFSQMTFYQLHFAVQGI